MGWYGSKSNSQVSPKLDSKDWKWPACVQILWVNFNHFNRPPHCDGAGFLVPMITRDPIFEPRRPSWWNPHCIPIISHDIHSTSPENSLLFPSDVASDPHDIHIFFPGEITFFQWSHHSPPVFSTLFSCRKNLPFQGRNSTAACRCCHGTSCHLANKHPFATGWGPSSLAKLLCNYNIL